MRTVADNWLDGGYILCEKVPFLFTKEKKQIIKALPMAYVAQLKDFILQHLDYLHE